MYTLIHRRLVCLTDMSRLTAGGTSKDQAVEPRRGPQLTTLFQDPDTLDSLDSTMQLAGCTLHIIGVAATTAAAAAAAANALGHVCRMWDGDTTYAKQNGGEFEFAMGGGTSLPMTQSFWRWLMAQSVQWGLQMYEQDWLYTEFVGVNGTLLRSATLGRQWLMQMDRGVHEHNMGLQLCMVWPRHVLQSLEMPSVTQARASSDYSVKSEQWRIGDNSLFLGAIGLRPTKDCFRSNSSSGEPYPRLQAAVSSLSGGPVFPCDEIGTSDVQLIMRSCNAAGELLQPTRAATPIDASILWKAGMSGSLNQASGEIWRADTWLDCSSDVDRACLHFPQILAAASGAYQLNMSELLDPGEAAPQLGFVAVETKSMTKATAVTATTSLRLPATTKDKFQIWSFSPRMQSGWALLGESTTKWVPVSTTRFEDLSVDNSDGLSVRVKGLAGEVVEISAVAPEELRIRTTRCVLPEGGVARVSFKMAGTSCEPV
eukprot:SAG31_NODE_234_length_19701_cov_16.835068_13_plen_485_part_00